jgi:hypothetical protein
MDEYIRVMHAFAMHEDILELVEAQVKVAEGDEVAKASRQSSQLVALQVQMHNAAQCAEVILMSGKYRETERQSDRE